jgi:hypothetical protein
MKGRPPSYSEETEMVLHHYSSYRFSFIACYISFTPLKLICLGPYENYQPTFKAGYPPFQTSAHSTPTKE